MGSNNTPADAHPRFGFTEKRIINEALTDSALVGVAVPRTAGLQFVVAMGTFTLSAGTGEVQLLVEGSNDNANWVTLGQTAPTENFTTNGQFQILNAGGTGQVDLEHWAWIRTRAVIVSGTPSFSLATIVTGIARDCSKAMRGNNDPFGPRLGTTPTAQNSTVFKRPAGTLLANCQAVASGVVLGGLTSFDVAVQGSPDGGTTWVDLATASITADGAVVLLDDTSRFFSLSQYFNLRFRVIDNGAAGVTTAFTSITFYLSLDDCDWVIDGDASGAGSGGLTPSDVFVSVDFGTPGAEAANTIAIGGQVYDADGAPLAEARKIELIVYDTSQAGDEDLSTNATFSATNTGTTISGLATNRLVLTTDASGAFNVDVLDVAVESVYVTAVNPRGPNATPQLIAAATEATLTFA